MPTPYLIRRPAGFYVRFGVPVDLRATLRTRFIVRSLHTSDPVLARLIAATLGAGLSSAFTAMRRGVRMDDEIFKKGLKHLQQGTAKDWVAGKIRLPNGLEMEGVQINNDEDARRFTAFVASQSVPSPAHPSELSASDPGASPAPAGPMLDSRAEAYLLSFKQSGRTIGNYQDTEHTIDLFVSLLGDMPIASITGDHVRTFIGYMERWPKNATKPKGLNKKRDKTPEEHASERTAKRALAPQILRTAPAKANATTLGYRAVEKHRDHLRKFFNWAKKERLIAANPMDGVPGLTSQASNAQTKVPFSDEDLAVIFQPERFAQHMAGDPARFWGMALCLYTGARVGEIAQIRVEDVECIQGVWGIHFRPWRKDQSQKNEPSLRFLPIHSALLAAGFIEYVQDIAALNRQHASQEANIARVTAKKKRVEPIKLIFPNLPHSVRQGYGDAMSDRINGYLRKHCHITDTQKSCHCFRHTFSNRLDGASAEILRIASLTGHSRSGTLARVYIQPTTLPDRVNAIEKLVIPCVTLAKYSSGQFTPWLREHLNLDSES